MRMSTFKFITYFLVAMALSNCSNQEKNITTEEEELLSFDVSTLDNKEYEIKLSDLMESVEIVQLDNSTEEAYTGIFKLGISDNYLVTSTPQNIPVKLFSRKDGRFIRNIGTKGQGPGEYRTIWNIMIDEKQERIHLGEPFQDKILTYDMNGIYHAEETINLPQGIRNKYVMYLEKEDNKAIVFNTPYTLYERGNIRVEGEKNTCWIQDLKGNIIDSISVTNSLSLPPGSSDIWASHVKEESSIYSFALRPVMYVRPDTLYHYNSSTNHLYPVYTPNTETALNIFTTSVESPLHYYTIQGFYEKGRGINPEFLNEWKIIQVDKESAKGRYIRLVNDLLGDIEIVSYDFFQNIKDNYAYIIYDPLDLKEQLEEALETNTEVSEEVRKRVVNMMNTLTEDSNDVLVICKFKEQ